MSGNFKGIMRYISALSFLVGTGIGWVYGEASADLKRPLFRGTLYTIFAAAFVWGTAYDVRLWFCPAASWSADFLRYLLGSFLIGLIAGMVRALSGDRV